MRCFISIDIPKEIQQQIEKIQEELPEFSGKTTETENLHLTLKFLGEIEENTLNKIKEKLKGILFKKFESEIDSMGVFSEKFIRIIWLHLSGVEKLQKEVDKSLKGVFEPEERFMGHLTIARLKSIRDRKKFLEDLGKITVPKIKFLVNKFSLKKSTLTSEGPIYETLQDYSLF